MNDWQDAEEHVERAHSYYEARRWDDAVAELRRALALNPYRAEWHFNLGLTYEAAGRYEDAVRAFRDACELEPESHQTLLALGANYLRLDDPHSAAHYLGRASKAEPTVAEPLVFLIEANARRGDHEGAELAFYMALQLEEVDEALAYLNMGMSLLDQEQHERAVGCLREAVRIDPSLPQAHARLAEAYAALGRKDRARQLYLRELRNSPGDVETLLDLGRLLIEINRLSDAGEKFRRVLELEPDNADAHFHLGELAVMRRREAEALAQFKLAVRIDQHHPRARRRLVELLLGRREEEEARRHLRAELRRWRSDPDTFEYEDLEELGGLLLDAAMATDAASVFDRMIQIHPEDASARHHFAVACFQLGRITEGRRASRAALRIEPEFAPAAYNIALSYFRQGKSSRSYCWVRRGMRIDPEDSYLKRLLMRLRVQRGITGFAAAFDTMRRMVGRSRRIDSTAAESA